MTVIGPMRLEPSPSMLEAGGEFLIRRMKHGADLHCGFFRNPDEARLLALVLSRVDDASFVAAVRQQLAEADAKIARSAA